jgi:hypothetical protein
MAFILVPVRAIATRRLNHGSPFSVLSGGVTPRVENLGENRFRRRCFRNRTKMKNSKKDAMANVPIFNPLHNQGEDWGGNFSDRLLNDNEKKELYE